MTDTKAEMRGGKELSELIRKELGSESNRDFLSRMPSFKPDAGMPDRLSALLGELDRAERSSRQAS